MVAGNPAALNSKLLCQILDANINRAREGLRVVEEIFRFVRKNKAVTAQLKALRHGLEGIMAEAEVDRRWLIECRDSRQDPGRLMHGAKEFSRASLRDIFHANTHRVGEAMRVLEEFSKLFDKRASLRFKALRFRFYDVEKRALRAL